MVLFSLVGCCNEKSIRYFQNYESSNSNQSLEKNNSSEVIIRFFELFEQGDFDTMKKMCTEEVKEYFVYDELGNCYFFGLEQAGLDKILIIDDDYLEDDNTENAEYASYEVTISGTSAPYAYSSWGDSIGLEEETFCIRLIDNGEEGWMLSSITTDY